MVSDSRTIILNTLRSEIQYLHYEFGVEQIGLFGSFARDDAHLDSDVDILVSLSEPLGFSFIRLADYLEEKLGRKVDLITASTLELGKSDSRRSHFVREIRESLVYV